MKKIGLEYLLLYLEAAELGEKKKNKIIPKKISVAF